MEEKREKKKSNKKKREKKKKEKKKSKRKERKSEKIVIDFFCLGINAGSKGVHGGRKDYPTFILDRGKLQKEEKKKYKTYK